MGLVDVEVNKINLMEEFKEKNRAVTNLYLEDCNMEQKTWVIDDWPYPRRVAASYKAELIVD